MPPRKEVIGCVGLPHWTQPEGCSLHAPARDGDGCCCLHTPLTPSRVEVV